MTHAPGRNAPPPVTLRKGGRVVLGARTYTAHAITRAGKPLGEALGRYTPPRPGQAGGWTFRAEIAGQSFTGSRARLLAWAATV